MKQDKIFSLELLSLTYIIETRKCIVSQKTPQSSVNYNGFSKFNTRFGIGQGLIYLTYPQNPAQAHKIGLFQIYAHAEFIDSGSL
jgi:hypothetical protein